MRNKSPIPLKNRIRLAAALTGWSLATGPLVGSVVWALLSGWNLIPHNGHGGFTSYFYVVFAIFYNFITALGLFYFPGSIPALIGGALFGLCVATFATQIRFTWLPRLFVGAASGAVSCTLFGLIFGASPNNFFLHLFGVPAGAICAVAYKLEWIERHLFKTIEPTVQGGRAEITELEE